MLKIWHGHVPLGSSMADLKRISVSIESREKEVRGATYATKQPSTKTLASNWTSSTCLVKALVNWLTSGRPPQLWMEIWKGMPASKQGTKQVIVGRPVDPLEDENSAIDRSAVGCVPAPVVSLLGSITDVVH